MSGNHNLSRINVLISLDHSVYDGNIHGCGRFFFNLVSKIDRERFNVVPCILRSEDSLKPAFERQGIIVRYLERGRFDPFVLFDFLRLIREEKIHVMHLNAFASITFGRLAGIITRVPTIIHGHALIDFYCSWYQQIIDWLLAKFTAQTIVISDAVREIYKKKRSINPNKMIVLPYGIQLEEFKPTPSERCIQLKSRLGIDVDHLVVGTVTRLRVEKGNRYFLEAAAEVLRVFPYTNFLIVGTGPLEEKLKRLASQLGIERKVIFAGFIQDIPSMLSILDIKVMASLSEGLGIAIIEAMAMGLPMVATNVGGIPDLVVDGETGYLVPPRDPHAMAEKVIYLLHHKKERERLGMNAHRESCKYGLDAYVRNVERVYEKVTAKLVK